MKFPLILASLAASLLVFSPASRAQMVTGAQMGDFDKTFATTPNSNATLRAVLVSSSAPGNVLWPGEQPKFTLQLQNDGAGAVALRGHVEVVPYGTRGVPGDIWKPQTVRLGQITRAPFQLEIGANSSANLQVSPKVSERLGGYGLVVDFGGGRRQFVASFARTFKSSAARVQFPRFCLDELPLPVLKRLGVGAIRWGVGYKPTTDPDYPKWYAEQARHLRELQSANIAVLFMVMGGDFIHPNQPLGRPRPWLDDKGLMQDTKFDLAWLPSYDADFQKFTRQFATDFGWPRGPINAFSLWNEPWEGISISGWGADMLRYREMYRRMAAGVLEARKSGVQVLVGGADSSSNALDKFFGDEAGRREFLPIFDFLSIHYQGLSPTSNLKLWQERKGYGGRVKIWDTESWVANTDDRVAAVVAGNRAAGYDRAMGVHGGNIAERTRVSVSVNGQTREVEGVNTWSTAAAVGASQKFIGERPFREMVYPLGLPWVMRFDGLNGQNDDGTLVVVGDFGDVFGANNLLFRTARGQVERAKKARLRARLAALPATDLEGRAALEKQIAKPETLSGATLTLRAPNDEFALFDPYGNRIASQAGLIRVPLDGRGFFLRAQKPGGFARLVQAVKTGAIAGIEPVAVVAHDFLAPIEAKPALRLTLTNVLNRPVSGVLKVQIPGLKLESLPALKLLPHTARTIQIRVLSGAARPDNLYALSVRLQSDAGQAQHDETIRANVISPLTPQLNGDLRSWSRALPQTVRGGDSAPSLTEAAWFPFKNFDTTQKNGLATGYLGYDARYFYFAAKIADSTPDAGMVRQATRDDDSYFYPPVSFLNLKHDRSFAARWSGTFEATVAGEYEFSTWSDDGVRLFINDKKVVDDWENHPPTENRATVQLAPGRHRIRLEYFQGDGGATMRLKWKTPGGVGFENIPPNLLFPEKMEGNGLRAEYFTNRDFEGQPLATRLNPAIDFQWDNGVAPDPAFDNRPPTPLEWPANVRRFSYRRNPDLPSGNAPGHDNVQIAFNVLPPAQKRMHDKLPGLPPRFTTYSDTDYEYALNPIAPAFGGGFEVWRLLAPGLPRKHFYPRQPKARDEGAVEGARMTSRRIGNTRILEAAIPWAEIPHVDAARRANRPIKFSFRVNDNNGPALELAQNRSVAKINPSFHVDWVEHWANEVEFGWGKPS